MEKIIKLTILTVIGGCIVMFIYRSVIDTIAMGLYAGIFTIGNILFPSFGGVLIYKLIKGKTSFKNVITTIILQAILLSGLFMLGLYIWAAAEAGIYKELTWKETKAVFHSEFSAFIPVVFSEGILIPILDKILTRHKSSKKSRIKTL